MSDSVQTPRPQPTRVPRPWDSPDKNTGVGCHFLLQCIKVKSESEVAQSCQTLGDPMDCSPPGSSIHGIFQARVLEWGAIELPDLDYPNPPQKWELKKLFSPGMRTFSHPTSILISHLPLFFEMKINLLLYYFLLFEVTNLFFLKKKNLNRYEPGWALFHKTSASVTHPCECVSYNGSLEFETEKAMAPHSSTLAWKIPWMEEPGRLPSMG